jgi:hypothetical protein
VAWARKAVRLTEKRPVSDRPFLLNDERGLLIGELKKKLQQN